MPGPSHSLIVQFERQWDLGQVPNVEAFLAANTPQSVKSLVQLILIDQSRRWETGDLVSVEHYFGLYPQLLAEAETAIDLLYAEFLLRENMDPAINVDEFVKRYPQFESELRSQIIFHQAGGSELINASFECRSPPQDDLVAPKDDIPGYELLSEIGRGGLGIVYLARDIRLNRHVALKMLIAGKFASSNLSKRLLVEAEAIARLQHPNIVQIYDVGQYNECPFLALEFISGGTLAQWMQRRPQPPRDAASITRQIALAIQYAHDNGVIHRDLKPSNLLIQAIHQGRTGGGTESTADPNQRSSTTRLSLSELHIKVADFGLAKLVQQDSMISLPNTSSGDLMGTIVYMSPEQAQAGSTELTTSTDIYSLGTILYELLTGRPPFVGVNPLEVLGQVVADEPVRPSQLVRHIPRDLQTICLKCLEKNPSRRYSTPEALAEDLQRYLSDQPIVARRASRVERMWRWCRRKPIETTLVASVATILMMIALLSSGYSIMLGNQLEIIKKSEQTEKSLKLGTLEQLWESHVSQADAIRTGRQVGQRFDSLKAIDSARELGRSIQFAPNQIDRLRNGTVASLALSDMRTTKQVKSHWPDGSLPSCDHAHELCAYLSQGKMAVVQRMDDGTEIACLETNSENSKLILSSDGQKLAICDNRCQIYQLSNSAAELIFDSSASGPWVFSPDGTHVIGLDGDHALQLVDLRTPQSTKAIGTFRGIRQIEISPDRQRAAMLLDESVQVVELDSGQVSFRAAPPDSLLYQSFAWHPNSQVLAIGPYDHGVELWDTVKSDKLITLPIAGPSWFQFDTKGNRLLSYNVWGHQVQLWDVLRGSLEFSRSGDVFLSLAADQNGGFQLLQPSNSQHASIVEIICPTIFQTLPAMRNESSGINYDDLSYSHDGRYLAYFARGEFEIFDTQQFRSLSKATSPFCRLRFALDGSLLTLNKTGVGQDGFTQYGLFRWQMVESDDLKNVTFGPPESVGNADLIDIPVRFEVSSDGSLVALGAGDGIKIVSTETEKIVQSQASHPDVRHVSFDVNSNRVASAGWNGGKVCIWDAGSGELLHTLPESDNCFVEFSPDGSMLAAITSQLTIWDTKSWSPVCQIKVPGRPNSGVCACFSPDGRTLAVSDSIGRVHMVDPRTGREFLLLTGPDRASIARLQFSPDGTQLAAANNPPRIWNLLAIQAELEARDLGWPGEGPFKVSARNDARYSALKQQSPFPTPSKVEIVFDKQFKQWEASYYVQLAVGAAREYEINSSAEFISRALSLGLQEPNACNSLAWLLATGPIQLRDIDYAVELAERAYHSDESTRSRYANTLGVALYRARRYPEALDMLQQSLAVQPAKYQAMDLYFLSMCTAELDDLTAARDYFDRAEALKEQSRSALRYVQQVQLGEFSKEAKSLLEAIQAEALSLGPVASPTD